MLALLPDGRQFAKDWCQFIHKSEAQTGMLQRGRDIEELQQHIESLTIQVETKTAEMLFCNYNNVKKKKHH